MNRSASPPEPSPDLLEQLGRSKRRPAWATWLKRSLLTVVIISLASWGMSKYLHRRAEAARPRFVTQQVMPRTLTVTVGATGTLAGLNTVEVGSEVSGKVTQIFFDFNDQVEKGETLAIIDPEQSQAAVSEARANVTSSDAAIQEARVTLDEAKANAARGKAQFEAGLSSRQEYEGLDATEKRAAATVTRLVAAASLARASLKSAESRLAKTVIVAPIDGIVQSRLVEVGQTLTAGMTTPVLFKLTEDLTQMRLSVAIDEADIGHVREGQGATFTVDAYPGKTFESKVVSIHNEPTTDQNVVTYEAILSVDNGQRLLRPGMTATATVATEQRKDVLSVPNAALRFSMPVSPRPIAFGPPSKNKIANVDTSEPGIWLMKDGKPIRVSTKIGVTDGKYSELLDSGAVAAGDEVIVDVEDAP